MHRRGLAWILFTLAFVVASSASRVEAQNPGIVMGRVTVEGERTPVGGATITLEQVDGRRKLILVADGHGRFSHVGVRPGLYTVVVESAGFAPVEIIGVHVRPNDKIRLSVEATWADEAPFTRRIVRYRRPLVNTEDATITTRIL